VKPDILYRVKRGESNEELRLSLRSLANLPHDQVVMVGRPPSWVQNVHRIQGHKASKWRALVYDLWLASKEMAGRSFILFDDDMYVLKAMRSMPVLHGGPLAQWLTPVPSGSYQRSLRQTEDYLAGRGQQAPLSYELHLPLPMVADAVVDALGPVVDSSEPVQARTVYGNVMGIGGREVDTDVKLRARGLEMPRPFASLANGMWRHYRDELKQLFPDPSPYEP